eukprot:jgi/Chlat1/5705/Chrsp38S05525
MYRVLVTRTLVAEEPLQACVLTTATSVLFQTQGDRFLLTECKLPRNYPNQRFVPGTSVADVYNRNRVKYYDQHYFPGGSANELWKQTLVTPLTPTAPPTSAPSVCSASDGLARLPDLVRKHQQLQRKNRAMNCQLTVKCIRTPPFPTLFTHSKHTHAPVSPQATTIGSAVYTILCTSGKCVTLLSEVNEQATRGYHALTDANKHTVTRHTKLTAMPSMMHTSMHRLSHSEGVLGNRDGVFAVQVVLQALSFLTHSVTS